MINFDDVTEENIKGHNPNWSQFPDHPYIILIIGSKNIRLNSTHYFMMKISNKNFNKLHLNIQQILTLGTL